jgi:hypothetical protein
MGQITQYDHGADDDETAPAALELCGCRRDRFEYTRKHGAPGVSVGAGATREPAGIVGQHVDWSGVGSQSVYSYGLSATEASAV